jgi:hypothetical protein
VVYWKALSEMTWAAAALDRGEEAVQYAAQAGRTQRAIQYHFWRADLGYFATSDTLPQLSSDGNLLAIAWGLSQADQADSILGAMQAAHMAEPVPTRVAFPSYPLNLIAMENRLGGMANYHTDASWLWLGAWHVVASIRAGRVEAARQLLTRIAEIIVRDRQVNEVHGPTGEPLSSTWYKPESPLAWNAGMVIYAFHVFESQQPQPEFQMLSLVVKDAR